MGGALVQQGPGLGKPQGSGDCPVEAMGRFINRQYHENMIFLIIRAAQVPYQPCVSITPWPLEGALSEQHADPAYTMTHPSRAELRTHGIRGDSGMLRS